MIGHKPILREYVVVHLCDCTEEGEGKCRGGGGNMLLQSLLPTTATQAVVYMMCKVDTHPL